MIAFARNNRLSFPRKSYHLFRLKVYSVISMWKNTMNIFAVRELIVLFVICAFSSIFNNASAQQVSTEGSQTTQTTRITDPITITATKNPLRAFDFPGMVSRITNSQAQFDQSSTIDDVLKLIPNLQFSRGPRRTGEEPSIRGVSGADVIILLDGARQNFGSAHDGRFFVDPSFTKEAEVLKGPASALYGSGGLGGVIEFRTLTPSDLLQDEDKTAVRFSAGYQDVNNERSATIIGAVRATERIAFISGVTKRSSGSIELGNGTNLTNTEDEIINALFKTEVKLDRFNSLGASISSFNNDAEEPSNGQGVGGDDRTNKDIYSNTLSVKYAYKNPSNKLFDIDFSIYRTETKVLKILSEDVRPHAAGDEVSRYLDTKGLRIDNRSRYIISNFADSLFTYGIEFNRNTQDGSKNGDELDGVPDSESDFLGVFVQAELSLVDPFDLIPGELLVIPGLRYDQYETSSKLADSNEDDKSSRKIGVTYKPLGWLNVFGSYSEAFRAPTFDELYLTGTHFAIPLGRGSVAVNRFVPNPALKPQTTETLEAGIGISLQHLFQDGDTLQLKGSKFRSKMDNFIDITVNQPAPFRGCSPFIRGDCDGTTNSDNVPEASLWGAEVELGYENERLVIGAGFSSINGKNDRNGEKLGSLTPDQFTFNIGAKLPEISSFLGWKGTVANEFDTVDDVSNKRPGYAVHDLFAIWTPKLNGLNGWRVTAGVDNVLDKSYSRVDTSAVEPGRNIKGTVSYTWNW